MKLRRWYGWLLAVMGSIPLLFGSISAAVQDTGIAFVNLNVIPIDRAHVRASQTV